MKLRDVSESVITALEAEVQLRLSGKVFGRVLVCVQPGQPPDLHFLPEQPSDKTMARAATRSLGALRGGAFGDLIAEPLKAVERWAASLGLRVRIEDVTTERGLFQDAVQTEPEGTGWATYLWASDEPVRLPPDDFAAHWRFHLAAAEFIDMAPECLAWKPKGAAAQDGPVRLLEQPLKGAARVAVAGKSVPAAAAVGC